MLTTFETEANSDDISYSIRVVYNSFFTLEQGTKAQRRKRGITVLIL
jgi:hypothetical protein